MTDSPQLSVKVPHFIFISLNVWQKTSFHNPTRLMIVNTFWSTLLAKHPPTRFSEQNSSTSQNNLHLHLMDVTKRGNEKRSNRIKETFLFSRTKFPLTEVRLSLKLQPARTSKYLKKVLTFSPLIYPSLCRVEEEKKAPKQQQCVEVIFLNITIFRFSF